MAVEQVRPQAQFPSGDSRALVELPFEPEDLTARYGLSFEEGYDDLDWYRLAAIALPDGSQAWLVKYRGEQEAGTTVYVDAAADLGKAKDVLLQTFALAEEDLRWIAPGVVAAGTGGP
jgi:hypothetical protein